MVSGQEQIYLRNLVCGGLVFVPRQPKKRQVIHPAVLEKLCIWMIFLPCSSSTAQVTLFLVHLEYLLHTVIQRAILFF